MMKDPVYVKKIQDHDAQLARKLDTKGANFTESKAEIKKILMEKIQMEGELTLKLSTMQVPNQQMAQQITMVERTKVLDTVYLKYGMKINYLMACVDRHQLLQDEDVKTLDASFKMKMEQR